MICAPFTMICGELAVCRCSYFLMKQDGHPLPDFRNLQPVLPGETSPFGRLISHLPNPRRFTGKSGLISFLTTWTVFSSTVRLLATDKLLKFLRKYLVRSPD